MRKGNLPDRFAVLLFAIACEFLAGRFEGERPGSPTAARR